MHCLLYWKCNRKRKKSQVCVAKETVSKLRLLRYSTFPHSVVESEIALSNLWPKNAVGSFTNTEYTSWNFVSCHHGTWCSCHAAVWACFSLAKSHFGFLSCILHSRCQEKAPSFQGQGRFCRPGFKKALSSCILERVSHTSHCAKHSVV